MSIFNLLFVQVSGSSARLTKNSAYHHFTLLLNVDKASLRSSLQSHPQLQPSNSIATNSERSDVINICTLNPGMAHEAVSAAIAEKFYDVHKVRENKQVRSLALADSGSRKCCDAPKFAEF